MSTMPIVMGLAGIGIGVTCSLFGIGLILQRIADALEKIANKP